MYILASIYYVVATSCALGAPPPRSAWGSLAKDVHRPNVVCMKIRSYAYYA